MRSAKSFTTNSWILLGLCNHTSVLTMIGLTLTVACNGGRHVGSTSHYGEVVDIIRLRGDFDAKILKVRQANDVPRQDGLAVWLRRINVRHVSLGLFDLITSDQVIGPVAYRPMAPGALGHRGASILLCEFQSALPEAAPDMMDIDDD
ncbi:hypothetical protein VP01_3517g1 [Puccinia sorghi]|uniref:Uncharacterized protein n=1 Tax=Puccinia sorghi TaxID=27349 RepID=A0A0L6UVJ1_9BASI|nr:hypothetical protein VP01_3517g1 [Puccinia sorghi]